MSVWHTVIGFTSGAGATLLSYRASRSLKQRWASAGSWSQLLIQYRDLLNAADSHSFLRAYWAFLRRSASVVSSMLAGAAVGVSILGAAYAGSEMLAETLTGPTVRVSALADWLSDTELAFVVAASATGGMILALCGWRK